MTPPYPSMSYLVERELRGGSAIFALDARFPHGEAWSCSVSEDTGCGPQPVSGRGAPGAELRIVLGGDVDRAFDGFYQLPSLTASPPALGLRRAPTTHRGARDPAAGTR